MEENRNDAFEEMNKMLAKKKENNEIRKLSEIKDIDAEIDSKIPYTEDEIDAVDQYERLEVQNSITPVDMDYEAKEVDINNIKIYNQKAIEKNRLLMEALKGKKDIATFEIVAAQSGYSCKLTPLNNRDSFNILNSSSSEYENQRSTYKVVYSKISEFSCGHMAFEEWLANTSVADIETFYYGLYCATFLDQGSFKFTCPETSCGHVTEQVIRNESLREVADFTEMTELSKRITAESNSKQKMQELSLLNKASHIELAKSGFIAEIRIPSLADFLNLYKQVKSTELKKRSDSDLNALLCVSGVLIPDGKGGYTPDIDKNDILQVIDQIPIYDAAALRNKITDTLAKYRVSYKIKTVRCAKCGKEIHDIPIDLRSILFTEIFASR